MKKKLSMVATIIVVLFINACTFQNKEACYINEKHNRQPVARTHLYNSQVPVKNQNLDINRQNSIVPTSTSVYSDKHQMLYQNSNAGADSIGPR